MKEAYPVILRTAYSDEDGAWQLFSIEVKEALNWIKGTGYWRTLPTSSTATNVDGVDTEWTLVRGRAFFVMEDNLEGYSKILPEYPYHDPAQKPPSLDAVGLGDIVGLRTTEPPHEDDPDSESSLTPLP